MRIVYHLHHTQDVFLINNDTRQTEHTPGGIIGMNRHVNIVFIAYRHDPLQEVLQILE